MISIVDDGVINLGSTLDMGPAKCLLIHPACGAMEDAR